MPVNDKQSTSSGEDASDGHNGESAESTSGDQNNGYIERTFLPSSGGRRRFLKATSVGLGTLLAGCSGGGGGDGNTTTSGSGGGGGGTTSGGQEQSLSGVTIDYWDVMNVQSQTARQQVQQTINNFQKETGATVKLNMSGYDQMSGQKWVQAWQNEEYPVAFNGEDFYFGRIIPTGHLKPFDDYKDQLDDSALDGMQWAMDLKSNAYRFWDIPGESGMINFPHAAGIRNPLTVRKDKIEEAGRSMDDIPDTGDAVKDYTQLMKLAQSIKQNTDVQFPYHGHAAWPDYNDTLAPWMAAHNAEGSRYISEDGTKAYPSDLWTPWVQRFVDMQHKWNVSGPQTASISDEDVATMLYAGDTALTTVEPLNYPTFIQRAPDVLKNGNLKMLPYPAGNTGAPGHVGFHDSGLNKKPSDADSKRWDRQLQVGYALKNRLLSENFQTGYPNMVGWMGINDTLWGETTAKYGEQTGFKNAMTTMLENSKITWPYHRYSNQIIFRTIAPYVQNAIKQQVSPAQAMKQARQESQTNIKSANDELGEPGSWPIK